MKTILLKLIRFYQQISFFRGCRFQPSCSEYTYQAIAKYGVLRGSWFGLKRIVRCHPLSKSGFDPVK